MTVPYCPALKRHLAGPIAPFLDGFEAGLRACGYSYSSGKTYLVGAVHLGAWCRRRGIAVQQLNENVLERFVGHFKRCTCSVRRRSSSWQRWADSAAARHVLRYLRSRGVTPPETIPADSPLVAGFRYWMLRHRGVAEGTARWHVRWARELVRTFGADPKSYRPVDMATFALERARSRRYCRASTQMLIGAIRMFIRYLVVYHRCSAALSDALPKVANWRLATLPRYLPPEAVECVLRVPDSKTPSGARNKAVLLLLARLGLRAGEVTRLRLSDLDWSKGRIRVIGSKNGRVAWLPLPGDVGAAIRRYLSHGRPLTDDDHLFIRTKAPFVGHVKASAITHIAARSLRKAGVDAPFYGAHVFRHSVATKLLRHGWTLDAIGALLRHRSRETTAIYAKVDLTTLRLVAQPWPR